MVEPGGAGNSQCRIFQLGLVLAGAISAGAYTAGVLDFLFQALKEWENARGTPGVPDHRVVLKVVSGASAGAISGALGAVALARGLQPRPFTEDQIANFYPSHRPARQEYQYVLQPLYKTWVELPAMVGADGRGALLGTGDIGNAGTQILKSLLNSTLLDKIKHAAIEPDENGALIQPPLPFIAKRLHLYITISNMRGIPFKVGFGRNNYGMQTMGDRIHYVVSDLGECDLSVGGSWVEDDARHASLSISVTTLPSQKGTLPREWDLFGTAALASGAFPLGLASRRLELPWIHYLERRFPIPLPEKVQIRPDFPQAAMTAESFVFESIDGGLVNNNPFDYAQYALTGAGAGTPKSGQEVDRAIVMVAPFPEPPVFPPEDSPSPAVAAIVRALFPALVNQARFRASELAPAVDERDFSRFLISPLRRIPRTKPPVPGQEPSQPERFSIACGLLSGFGGFLAEEFRSHDFQLGRRNCQQFLRNSFDVPSNNNIVGQANTPEMPLRPIIPLFGTAADPMPLPRWPQMSQEAFSELCAHIRVRIDAMIPELINAQTPSLRLRKALLVGWRVFLRSRTIAFVRWTMLADLVRRSQIAGWEAPSLDELAAKHERSRDDVQAIIAELVGPAFDFRTPAGIARRTHLKVDFVHAILEGLSKQEIPKQVRTWSDSLGYTLFERRPGWVERWRVVRWFNRWWNAPKVS
jgi:hypothetical protein